MSAGSPLTREAPVVVGRIGGKRLLLILAALLSAIVLWSLATDPTPTSAGLATAPPATSPGKSDSKLIEMLTDAVAEFEEERARGGGSSDRRSDTTTTRSASNSDAGNSDDGSVRFDDEGRVQVYIWLESSSRSNRRDLEDLGAEIEVVDRDADVVQAWVPTSALASIEALENVITITPPDYGVTRAGSVTTEGDKIHRGNLVRAFSSLTGSGVRVGVISNGADSRAEAQATNDLPATIEIDPNRTGSGEEGGALMEIIHDIAPDASLAFSGPATSKEMIQAIDWLANDAFGGNGADIIVDDFGFLAEPYFEDGSIAKKAEEVVDDGVIYITSTGNDGEEHYTGTFSRGEGDYHEFAPGDISLRITGGDSGDRVFLQWNDEFGKAATDYDLYACGAGLEPTRFNLQNRLCTRSTRIQDGNDIPYESLDTPDNALIADIYIKEFIDPQHIARPAKTLKLLAPDSTNMEYGSASGSIFGIAAASGPIAVGAISASDPGHDTLQSFSSQGPVEIYFPSRETRVKPDIVAIDGVTVTGAGGFPNNFVGTSAAAPHVVGVAALILQAERIADNTRSKEDIAEVVRNRLKDNATDLGVAGVDNSFGAGRVDALTAAIATGQLNKNFVVNSTGDGADDDTSDGACDDGSGNCTLRAAIQEVNAGSGGVITFGITGDGPHSIQPAAALPTITKTVFIDGLSQTGAAVGTIKIELDGTNAGASTNGLTLTGTDSHVRGLAVNRFGGNGIVVQTGADQIVEDNYIGTDPAGTTDRGNGGVGLYIQDVSDAEVRYNLISGNTSHGITLSGTENTAVIENRIGVSSSGTAMANDGAGVRIENGTRLAKVWLNEIANNGGDGVAIVSDNATINSVRANSIYSNGGLGIDLGDDGVTANDVMDADSGPNGKFNFPTLTNAARNGTEYEVQGSHIFESTSSFFVMDVYSNDSCDVSGNGEGKTYLGSTNVTVTSPTDIFLAATVDGTVGTFDRTVGDNISVTAQQGGTLGSTSEFSACLVVGELPLLDLSTEFVKVTEGATATYTVKLTEQPSSEVTLAFEGDSSLDVTVSPNPITFTTSDWSTARTVTVAIGTDIDPLGFQTEIRHEVTIDGKSVAGTPVTVVVKDKDTEPRVSVAIADLIEHIVDDAVVEVAEGNELIYQATLTEQPSSTVVVSLDSDNSGAVNVTPSTLTFTPLNWSTAQDVRLVSNVDADTENEFIRIRHKRSIGGQDYIVGTIFMRILDGAQPQPSLGPTPISLNEGQTTTYSLSLAAAPVADVKLEIFTNDSRKAIVWPREFNFTPLNWATGQTVTVTGVLDTNSDDEITTIWHYWHPVGGSVRLVGQLDVHVTDQALPFLNISKDELEITEGSSDTYTVAMAAVPSADITVLMTSLDTGVATVSLSSITFTTTNWDTAIPVTVTALSDMDDFDEVADIRHEITLNGNPYILATLTAKILEPGASGTNDSPTFIEGDDTDREIREDASGGSNVGDAVEAFDTEDDTLNYSLHGADAGFFIINSANGQISLRNSTRLNYEIKGIYSVSVSVHDGKNYNNHQSNATDDTINVEIKVVNVNEPGALTLSPSTPRQQVASVANLTDPDGSVGSAIWQWHTSPTGANPWTLISSATTATYTPVRNRRWQVPASLCDICGSCWLRPILADHIGQPRCRNLTPTPTPTATPATPTPAPAIAQHRRWWRRRRLQESPP